LKQTRNFVSILVERPSVDYLVPPVDYALAKDAVLVHTVLEVLLHLYGVILEMSAL